MSQAFAKSGPSNEILQLKRFFFLPFPREAWSNGLNDLNSDGFVIKRVD